MKLSQKIRVAVVHNIMAPQIVPVFNHLSKLDGIELKVFFSSKTASHRRWQTPKDIRFDYKILPSFSIKLKSRVPLWLSPTVLFELIKGDFDVVISGGYELFGTYLALLYSRLWHKPFIFRSMATVNEKSWRRKLGLPLLKIMARYSDTCITSGSLAKELLVHMGAKPEKVFVSYNTIDIDYFHRTSRLTKKEKQAIKTRLGLTSPQVILFVGRLVRLKGIKDLLSAFALLQTEGVKADLLIIGYGPEEEKLKSFCKQKELEGVFFPGAKNKEELPAYYAISDIFVLPSYREVWGLVLNEAMACGLPVITTSSVGASADLVKNGVNGFVVPPQDEQALFKALRDILGNPSLKRKMEVASLEIVKNFNFYNAVRKWEAAIKAVCRPMEKR